MAGYWSKAVEKLFKDAEDITEDWDEKTVTFELQAHTTTAELTLSDLLKLSKLLGTDAISFELRGDGRYADQNEYGAILRVTATGVKFPSPA